MIDTAAKDSSRHSDELKASQRDQRTVCEKQQNIRKQNHDGLSGEPSSKSGSRHVHKTAAWTNISVTDT